MSTERPPTLTPVDGGYMVRMRCGTTARERIVIFTKQHTPYFAEQALARYWRLRRMVDALVKAKRGPEAVALVRDAAAARTDRAFGGWERAALDIANREPEGPADAPTLETYGDVVRRWLSGELAADHPGEVKEKTPSTVSAQWQMYNKLILKHRRDGRAPLGELAIDKVTLDDLDAVKRSLPRKMGASRRKHYCMLIAKPMKLAFYPLRLIAANPVPDNFVPGPGKTRAFTYLYPDEEAATLACERIALALRMVYGFTARNGLRISEALGLSLRDFDLKRGNVSLDANKTRAPRSWKLDEDCTRALRLWVALCPPESPTAPVFGIHTLLSAARNYRTHLRWAGLDRRELFELTTERRPMRVHDLRASFVTLALAAGRGAPTTELWVRDRTGHTTPEMMETYRRWSRFATDNEQGWFSPLDEAIPELARFARGGRGLVAGALGVGHDVGQTERNGIKRPS